MKQIILLDTSVKEFDVELLKRALDCISCKYEINQTSKSVLIEGNNDVLASAKRALINSGYLIL